MKDRYPDYDSISEGMLVPAELQPEYLELPGVELGLGANLGDLLSNAHVRAGRGNQAAIVHHEADRVLTYAELSAISDRLANALVSLGIRPGDRVAYRSPNRPEPLLVSVAAWKVGAVVVPVPLQAKAAEVAFFLQDTTPKVCFVWVGDESADEMVTVLGQVPVPRLVAFGGVRGGADTAGGRWEHWDDLLARAGETWAGPCPSLDGPALVWHTGGTTGAPKACYHTQRRFLLGGYSIARATGAGPGQRWAAAAPIGHALGFIYHTNFTLLHGATVVLVERFADPEALLDAVAARRVDTLTAIAATWDRMLAVSEKRPGPDVSSLRRAYAMWQSASSGAVRDGWRARGVELLNNFGSTAFATWVLVPRGDEHVPPASLGRPAPGFVVEAVSSDGPAVAPVPAGTVGRMAVRGPTGLTYWNRPEQQHRDVVDGWTLVDDLIRFDGNGCAEYLGRTDFLISTAGYKVAPGEVEEVLSRHPQVAEVAVIGTPDPVRQEVVTAFVALRHGACGDPALVAELQRMVKEQLSPYKYPRIVRFVDALPRDHVGKVQPRRLRERKDA